MTAPDDRGTLVAIDFDGTLTGIIDDPSQSRPTDGVIPALRALGAQGLVIAVISGRPLDFLFDRFEELRGESWFHLVGEYGMERYTHGTRHSEAVGDELLDSLRAANEAAALQGPNDMLIEAKPHSTTLHYRTIPDQQQRVEDLAAALADQYGLTTRPAKMSVELHIPLSVSKGTALRSLVTDLFDQPPSRVIYLGDDIGDLPAFEVLNEFEDEGMSAIRVVVRGPETPPELLTLADVFIEGPQATVDYLEQLAAA